MRTTSDRAKWRRSFVLVGVAALVAGTLACGGDDGTDTASAGSSTPATSSTYGIIGDPVEETTEPTGAPSEVIVTEVAAPTDRMSDVTLYAPDTDGSWPVTVLFSGWGSSRSVLDPFARTLAAEGVVVATVDSGTPDEILAGEYECSQRLAVLSAWDSGADPTAPVAVGGHSMGAGLALMASVFDPFISMTTGGPLDCGLEGENALPPVDLVIGLGGAWAPAECDVLPGVEGLTAMVADGFPAYVHPYDGNPSVPIMMAHGTADGACPIEATRAAAQAFEADGHPVELLVFEGGGHSGGMLSLDPGDDPDAPADPDAAEGREVVAAIVRALSPAELEAGPDEAASAATGVDIITDVEYLSTGPERFLVDVYRPEGDGPFPVIVLFHPGDPTGKDAVSTTMRAQALAEAGLLVFAPTWNTEFTAPTSDVFIRSMDRASCALAYAEEHAPDHDGDVSAIATFGGSAGAQPAAWLALGHGTPGEGCVADADPIVPDGAVLIDSEYFLHSTVFQPLFDREPDAARSIVAGFVDPTGWSPSDAASFRLAAAETQAMLVRPIDEPGDPASWLAQRDVDGSLVADLENLGALDDGTVDHLDEARLLQHRLERAGIDATVTTLAGDHTTAVGESDDPTLTKAALEATGVG